MQKPGRARPRRIHALCWTVDTQVIQELRSTDVTPKRGGARVVSHTTHPDNVIRVVRIVKEHKNRGLYDPNRCAHFTKEAFEICQTSRSVAFSDERGCSRSSHRDTVDRYSSSCDTMVGSQPLSVSAHVRSSLPETKMCCVYPLS